MSNTPPPPRHQSLWFPAAQESGEKSSQGEPESPPPRPSVSPEPTAGLGWKAPRRVRVPIFERDAAQENTTPFSVPAAILDACFSDRAFEVSGTDAELDSLAQSHAAAITALSAPHRPPRPTANDETVRLLRDHIVPLDLVDYDDDRSGPTAAECAARFTSAPTPPGEPEAHAARDAALTFRHRQIAEGMLATAGLPSGASAGDEIASELRAPAPTDDSDFLEIPRAPSPIGPCRASFQEVVHFAPPDPIPPPKGAQAAQAPADPCGRDDATPNDGVVPQGITVSIDGGGSDDLCSFAFWSNGKFTICPSDGVPLVLNRHDARALLRYVSEALSARARAAA